MPNPQTIGTIIPNPQTLAGRMLAAGQLTVTTTSERTGEHITIKLVCKQKTSNGGWARATFAEATHVFASVPSTDWSDRVGTFYPRTGIWYDADGADSARSWTAQKVIGFAASAVSPAHARMDVASRCGRCGRELTDPESIARGIGPECIGILTGSRHERRNAPVRTPRTPRTPRTRVTITDETIAVGHVDHEQLGFVYYEVGATALASTAV